MTMEWVFQVFELAAAFWLGWLLMDLLSAVMFWLRAHAALSEAQARLIEAMTTDITDKC